MKEKETGMETAARRYKMTGGEMERVLCELAPHLGDRRVFAQVDLDGGAVLEVEGDIEIETDDSCGGEYETYREANISIRIIDDIYDERPDEEDYNEIYRFFNGL